MLFRSQDLALLKKVIKKYKSKEEYDTLFRKDEKGSYSAYINSFNAGKRQRRNMKDRRMEDFYKTLNKLLKDLGADEEVAYILEEIDRETFLPN